MFRANTVKTPPVAIVNREFVRRLFHFDNAREDDAVGGYFKSSSGQPIQIVGVVADGQYFSLTEDPEAAAFDPISQQPTAHTSFIVRLRPDSSEAATNEMGAPVALGLFGALGLLLSIADTFGLASYAVSKRLRELSIRVALGAQAKQILAAALGRMMILLASGSVVGMLLGVAASRVLSAIVYQAPAQDPFVLAAVVSTMVLTGSLAVAGPVRRALRIDPANVLRQE
jgi:hypothetical protein